MSITIGMRVPFEAALIGYEPGTMGYRLWNIHAHSQRLQSSWDVTFDESNSRFLQGREPRPAPESPAPSSVQAPNV